MPLPGFLTKIFGGKAAELATSVTDGLDKLFTSKEEKLAAQLAIEKLATEHLEKMQGLAQAEVDSYLKDTQDARASNVAIQNSDKASWLSKNVGYILDLFLGAIWGATTLFIIGRALKLVDADHNADMTAVLSIYGTITAVFMISLQFHRGTSKGSEDKSKELKEMRNK